MIKPLSRRPEWYLVDIEAAEKLVGIPGYEWDPGKGCARVHRNMLTLLDSTEAREALAAGWTGNSADWEARDVAARAVIGPDFKYRTTQHQAIDFLCARRASLLGDDMRLGKTLSALGAHDPARGPLVVIAPLSARAVWLGWIKRLWPDTPIGIMTGKRFDPEQAKQPIVFGHYDILTYWRQVKKLGTIIFDEAHLISNSKTNRGAAATVVAALAERRIALTGTPIWNKPADLWGVLALLAPKAFGSFYDFANRYGDPEPTGYGNIYEGISNEAELRLRMTEFMLRRRWVDVADDLPPITRSVVVAEVDEPAARRLDILAAKLKSDRTNTAGNLAAYRRQVTSTKLSTVVAEANRVMDRGEPVVVWTWHKDYAEAITAELGTRAVMIHGDIGADAREARITHWKAQPNHALVLTMSVGQVAIDLSHARVAIFAEIDWTPAIIAQAEMRTFKMGRPMDVLFVIANHIVDQRIVRALVNKLGAQDQLGVGAANAAIDALRDAVMGPEDCGDLDRMLEDMIASMA